MFPKGWEWETPPKNGGFPLGIGFPRVGKHYLSQGVGKLVFKMGVGIEKGKMSGKGYFISLGSFMHLKGLMVMMIISMTRSAFL